ncbi:hypothetical protein [Cellvibrio japonicus]|uniref:hypothetical protein n=1 Tax=Cellvibrio japonicus TaxID=155077 RepID=UPI0011D15F5F|nr:hypothetical protein [Cellvibrio japonicus]QEI10876.1 hypothetical protein FY117_00615 [Cellvibrio japonicus]QEI14452.1 hypothetical protein FY116_00615 [Cellvibrio japonicus]QEI18030.1 hypothetical protein FY115_00615 [Cellvibrio japonicus]
MKNWFLIGIFMASSSCSVNSKSIDFEGLKIPQEYVLHAPSEGPKGVFDDESIGIALVVPEDEVKRKIPRYQIENRGKRELSFVVEQSFIDLNAVSNSVLTSFVKSDTRVDADKYLPYERLYRSSDSWLLVSSEGGGKFLEAQCSRSGLTGNVEVCYFKKNVNGYGVSFHLENTNIALAKEFEDFISDKIENWRK